MSTAIVKIKMDSAAFEGQAGGELARILRNLAGWIEEDYPAFEPGYEYAVYDINGNTVGKFEVRA